MSCQQKWFGIYISNTFSPHTHTHITRNGQSQFTVISGTLSITCSVRSISQFNTRKLIFCITLNQWTSISYIVYIYEHNVHMCTLPKPYDMHGGHINIVVLHILHCPWLKTHLHYSILLLLCAALSIVCVCVWWWLIVCRLCFFSLFAFAKSKSRCTCSIQLNGPNCHVQLCVCVCVQCIRGVFHVWQNIVVCEVNERH